MAAVMLDDLPGQRQPHAGSLHVALTRMEEWLKDIGELRRIQRRAIILNIDEGAIRLLIESDAHLTIGGGRMDGMGEQVIKGLREPLIISVGINRRLRQIGGKLDAHPVSVPLLNIQGTAQHVLQDQPAGVQAELFAGELGHIHQILHEIRHVVGRFLDNLNVLMELIRLATQQIDARLEITERAAEFMRGVGDKSIPLSLQGLFQADIADDLDCPNRLILPGHAPGSHKRWHQIPCHPCG